jgi:hypothetical protein
MRFLIAALLLCGYCMSVRAQLAVNVGNYESNQSVASPLVSREVRRVAYKIAYPPGYRMRNTGRTLTLIGGAMLIGGIIVYSNADENYYSTVQTSSGTYTEGDPKAAVGVLMIGGGTGMAVPGIIFWTKGAKTFKRHMEKQAAFRFNGNGLSLSYNF